MDFIGGVTDYGAKEINVTGVAAIERISDGQMRTTYYVERRGDLYVPVHLIWDRWQFFSAWSRCQSARNEILIECLGRVRPEYYCREVH